VRYEPNAIFENVIAAKNIRKIVTTVIGAAVPTVTRRIDCSRPPARRYLPSETIKFGSRAQTPTLPDAG
jgi:hypothetical protein